MPGCLRQPGPGRAYERRIALLRLVADFLHQVASSPRLALLAPPPGAAHGAYGERLLDLHEDGAALLPDREGGLHLPRDVEAAPRPHLEAPAVEGAGHDPAVDLPLAEGAAPVGADAVQREGNAAGPEEGDLAPANVALPGPALGQVRRRADLHLRRQARTSRVAVAVAPKTTTRPLLRRWSARTLREEALERLDLLGLGIAGEAPPRGLDQGLRLVHPPLLRRLPDLLEGGPGPPPDLLQPAGPGLLRCRVVADQGEGAEGLGGAALLLLGEGPDGPHLERVREPPGTLGGAEPEPVEGGGEDDGVPRLRGLLQHGRGFREGLLAEPPQGVRLLGGVRDGAEGVLDLPPVPLEGLQGGGVVDLEEDEGRERLPARARGRGRRLLRPRGVVGERLLPPVPAPGRRPRRVGEEAGQERGAHGAHVQQLLLEDPVEGGLGLREDLGDVVRPPPPPLRRIERDHALRREPADVEAHPVGEERPLAAVGPRARDLVEELPVAGLLRDRLLPVLRHVQDVLPGRAGRR